MRLLTIPIRIRENRVICPSPSGIRIHLVRIGIFETNPGGVARVEHPGEVCVFSATVKGYQSSFYVFALHQGFKEIYTGRIDVVALVSQLIPTWSTRSTDLVGI